MICQKIFYCFLRLSATMIAHTLVLVLFASFEVTTSLNNAYLPPVNESYSYGSEAVAFGSIGYAEDSGSSTIEGPNIEQNFISSSYSEGSTSYEGIIEKRPKENNNHSQIFKNENLGDGNYNFSYGTDNIFREEWGHSKILDSQQIIVVEGSYSYTSPDGKIITVHYIADENGFRAFGDHIPTPPPISKAILKSLEYNAKHYGY